MIVCFDKPGGLTDNFVILNFVLIWKIFLKKQPDNGGLISSTPRACYFASANENFLLWGHFPMISLFLFSTTHSGGSLLNPLVPTAMCILYRVSTE